MSNRTTQTITGITGWTFTLVESDWDMSDHGRFIDATCTTCHTTIGIPHDQTARDFLQTVWGHTCPRPE